MEKTTKKLINLYTEINVTPLTLGVNLLGWTHDWIIKTCNVKSFGTMALLVKEYEQGFCIEEDKFTQAHKEVVNLIKKNKLPLDLATKKSIDIGNSITENIINSYYKLEKLNNKELVNLFLKISEQGRELCSYGFIAPLSDFPQAFISEEMERILEKRQAKKDITFLTQSSMKRPLQIAREELLQIIVNNVEVMKWLDKWFWIEFGHLGPILTINKIKEDYKEYFTDKTKAKNELFKIKDDNDSLKERQEKRFKELTLTRDENLLFYQAQQISFLKAYRTDILFCVYAFFDKLLEVCSKESGINKNLLMFATKEELINLLAKDSTKVKKDILFARKKTSVWITKDKDNFCTVLEGEEAIKFIKNNIISEELTETENIIKGNVAFPGKVTGTAKIVRSFQDMNKVKEGNVLVSPQTSPELLPAMKKACAFVTDIGGITSHAAIVAREMRKPCLVGTKNATQVLKDGDEVMIDTNHGYLKILKRA